jgi:hypothetical protein
MARSEVRGVSIVFLRAAQIQPSTGIAMDGRAAREAPDRRSLAA